MYIQEVLVHASANGLPTSAHVKRSSSYSAPCIAERTPTRRGVYATSILPQRQLLSPVCRNYFEEAGWWGSLAIMVVMAAAADTLIHGGDLHDRHDRHDRQQDRSSKEW